jgi:hypothetical protein
MSTKRFYVDLSSIISIYKPAKILGFTKMFRVARLGQFINLMKVSPLLKIFLKLLKLVFYLFLSVHILGCFMWFVVKIRQDAVDYDGRSLRYIPPIDWINYSTSDLFTENYSDFKRYLICLYYGILILGVNELGPVNTEEMLYFCIVLMITAIMNSLFFSDIIMLVYEL